MPAIRLSDALYSAACLLHRREKTVSLLPDSPVHVKTYVDREDNDVIESIRAKINRSLMNTGPFSYRSDLAYKRHCVVT
jgi:hypothetical protein